MEQLEYCKADEFQKDYKALKKRFITLDSDFARAKKFALELYHLQFIDNNSVEKITDKTLGNCVISIYKLKKFACRALQGGANSGIRVIYALEIKKITFLEIYYKGDKNNEDRNRISKFFTSRR